MCICRLYISGYNSFLGVEVLGEKKLVVTNEAINFHWKDHGFKLQIPDNSLPKVTPEYSVNIRVSLTGQFKIPEGYELVSAVYWVATPGNFTKPITIQVQHCANFSNPDQLHFIFSSHAQRSLPHNFQIMKEGSFILGSNYGTLSTTHFCGIGVVREITPGEQSCKYCAQVYFTAKQLQNHLYYCHFVITKDLQICLKVSTNKIISFYLEDIFKLMSVLQVVKEKYQQDYDLAVPITFAGDYVALDIPDDGVRTDNGWEVRPLYRAHVSLHSILFKLLICDSD